MRDYGHDWTLTTMKCSFERKESKEREEVIGKKEIRGERRKPDRTKEVLSLWGRVGASGFLFFNNRRFRLRFLFSFPFLSLLASCFFG
jgi:hypothetical protein